MKTPLLFVLIASLGLTFFAQAQVSEGGTPISYALSFKKTEIPLVSMPAVNVDSLLAEDALNTEKEKPFRFGFNFMRNIDLKQSSRVFDVAGGKLYLLGINCPGAFSINLAFRRFYIPPGANLYLYNDDKSGKIGALTWRNVQEDRMLGCDLLPGETTWLEYFEPADADFSGELTIGRITHGYRSLLPVIEKSFGQSGSCNVNINCLVAAPFADQKRGVACIVENGNEVCTGSLVNNTAQDNKLYFLTANHCLGGATASTWNTSTWVYRFNWEAAACPNPTSSPSTSQSISGSYLRAQSAGSDVGLLELFGTAPVAYNLYLNGWDRNNTAADSVFCIHHPSGDIKKFSKAANPVVSSTYSSAQCWRIGQWTLAATEPGSSGSPLFNPQKLIIGQLYGGPSSCNASPTQMNDYYGKFFTSWTGGGTNTTRLSNWLDPGNTGASTLNGKYANQSTNVFNIALGSIQHPPANFQTCRDSIRPVITLQNAGNRLIDSITVSVVLDGSTVTQYFTGLGLSQGQSTSITLSLIQNLSAGTHTLQITVSSSSGIIDADTGNNSLSRSFVVVSPQPVAPYISEGFQGAFPATGWSIVNPNANAAWILTAASGGFGNSTAAAQFDNFNDNTLVAGQLDYLVMPFVNFSSALSPVVLRFNRAYATFQSRQDSLLVAWTDNCGDTWNRLYAKGGTGLSTNGGANTNNAFFPLANQWQADSVNLDALIGKTNVRLAFINKTALGNNLFIDDINLDANGTGLREKTAAGQTYVYPNPSQGMITLVLPEASLSGTMRLFDASGREVLVKNMINGSTQQVIDATLLSRGIYLLQVNMGGKVNYHKICLR